MTGSDQPGNSIAPCTRMAW